MNTSDQHLSEENLAKLQSELQEEQLKCATRTKESMQKEIVQLNSIKSVISEEEIMPEMLIMPMHNLISIVPEEQYRFLPHLQKMFLSFASEYKSDKTIKYLSDRLSMMKEEDLNSKAFQLTDLSQYWSAYRASLYRLGIEENSKQIKAQKALHEELIAITDETIAKREQGINTANALISNAGA